MRPFTHDFDENNYGLRYYSLIAVLGAAVVCINDHRLKNSSILLDFCERSAQTSPFIPASSFPSEQTSETEYGFPDACKLEALPGIT